MARVVKTADAQGTGSLIPSSRHPVILSILLFTLATAGCGKPNPADRPLRPEQVTDFAVLYRQNCAGCHGADGKLGPAPPLNDPLFLAIVPRAELQRVIADGRSGTPMPAFAPDRGGSLTDEQVRILALGVEEKWGGIAAPQPLPSYDAPEKEQGSKDRGVQVFARACAGCHGDQGQGGKHGAEVVGAVNDRAFLALISDQALRRLIITGRPDLGMPSYAEAAGRPKDYQPLTSQEIADLAALLAYWRQGN
jgi:mono/diheme cytochrome c family protein